MKESDITVTLTEYGKKTVCKANAGTLLKELFEREGIRHSFPCAGEGRCGGCRVRFITGAPKPEETEKRLLSEKELSDGIRLSCQCRIFDDCEIVLSGEKDMRVLTDVKDLKISASSSAAGEASKEGSTGCGVAVDLGTTTIAAALVKREGENFAVIKTASSVNRQRSYGADVISRIAAAADKDSAQAMMQLVREDISSLIKELTEGEASDKQISTVTIAGNTTMLHLLAGKDLSGMGSYPYKPQSLELEELEGKSLFPDFPEATVTLLPGISAFVGADIVAGLYALDPGPEESIFFLDLGTNGEMAYYDKGTLEVTSTAAGPVFEAGGISCGTAGVPGAICRVCISDRVTYETIDNRPPCGICGTGVTELVSELVRSGIIDETGLLKDEYFEDGFPVTEDGHIRFTQADIRNVQLAKAAVFCGAKALLRGRRPDKVYVSGGFGSAIDAGKIERLGLFPKELSGRIEPAGNSSLAGAIKYTGAVLMGGGNKEVAIKRITEISQKASVIELASLESFGDDYIEAMNF